MTCQTAVRAVGLGAGGHARVVVDILKRRGDIQVIGLLDPDRALRGTTIDGIEVIGDDSLLSSLVAEGVSCAFVGLGSTGNGDARLRLYDLAKAHRVRVIDAVHPKAVIAASASFGQGFTAMACSVVNPGARLGENVIVNTGAIIEHDCVLGDHVHVAPGAVLAGGVRIGALSHIGLGARVMEGVTIGERAVVGAGAVVIADVPSGSVVAGVPARPLERGRR